MPKAQEPLFGKARVPSIGLSVIEQWLLPLDPYIQLNNSRNHSLSSSLHYVGRKEYEVQMRHDNNLRARNLKKK